MKIWFLADLHFGCRADNEIWLKDYCDYFYNVFIPLLKEKYKEGDIVCLIEAMKTFNPVKAHRSGTVTKILVESGDPVEYGESLLVIE